MYAFMYIYSEISRPPIATTNLTVHGITINKNVRTLCYLLNMLL